MCVCVCVFPDIYFNLLYLPMETLSFYLYAIVAGCVYIAG